MSLEDKYLQDLENDFEISDDEEQQEEEEQEQLSRDGAVSSSKDGSSINDFGNDNINTATQSSDAAAAQTLNKKANTNDNIDNDDDVLMANINDLVAAERNMTTEDLISRLDMKSVKNIKSVSKLLNLLDPVLKRIDQLSSSDDHEQDFATVLAQTLIDNPEYQFLVRANEFSAEISNEIMLVHSFLKASYSPRFPELETIVVDPVDFAKTVLVIGNDLQNVPQKSPELKKILTGEKVLVINMSILELATAPLPQDTMDSIYQAAEIIARLYDARAKVIQFVSSHLAKFAPNLTALVGSHCAVQLMSYSGGLEGLSKTPSCNVPSIGSKRPIRIGFGQTGIRQQGFLYNSPIISRVPDDIKKQAMRIVSGKLILAARVDYSGSCPDGSFASKTLDDINKKIDKLLEPPENVGPKALPIPVDKTSKKRGGKRFRKFKEKFEMTELQKAQNRMAFGKEEDTVMNSYGEQIGLGLAGRNSLVSTGRVRAIKASNKSKQSLSKKMSNRLANADGVHNEVLLALDPAAGGASTSLISNGNGWIQSLNGTQRAAVGDVRKRAASDLKRKASFDSGDFGNDKKRLQR